MISEPVACCRMGSLKSAGRRKRPYDQGTLIAGVGLQAQNQGVLRRAGVGLTNPGMGSS
jgi:hypothetical protein